MPRRVPKISAYYGSALAGTILLLVGGFLFALLVAFRFEKSNVVLGFLCLLLVAAGGYFLGWRQGRREGPDHEYCVLLEQWQVTLARIGDAVMVTDSQGRVIFMNRAAQVLSGWREEWARGKPLDEVFITSEAIGHGPSGNPALRVLKEEVVIDEGNYAFLQARDGGHHRIETSAAPIREEDGRITGVVVIFRATRPEAKHDGPVT